MLFFPRPWEELVPNRSHALGRDDFRADIFRFLDGARIRNQSAPVGKNQQRLFRPLIRAELRKRGFAAGELNLVPAIANGCKVTQRKPFGRFDFHKSPKKSVVRMARMPRRGHIVQLTSKPAYARIKKRRKKCEANARRTAISRTLIR